MSEQGPVDSEPSKSTVDPVPTDSPASPSTTSTSWWTRGRLLAVVGSGAVVIVGLIIALIVVSTSGGDGGNGGGGGAPLSDAWHAGNDYGFNGGGSDVVGSDAQESYCEQGASSYTGDGGDGDYSDFIDGCLAFFNP